MNSSFIQSTSSLTKCSSPSPTHFKKRQFIQKKNDSIFLQPPYLKKRKIIHSSTMLLKKLSFDDNIKNVDNINNTIFN